MERGLPAEDGVPVLWVYDALRCMHDIIDNVAVAELPVARLIDDVVVDEFVDERVE